LIKKNEYSDMDIIIRRECETHTILSSRDDDDDDRFEVDQDSCLDGLQTKAEKARDTTCLTESF